MYFKQRRIKRCSHKVSFKLYTQSKLLCKKKFFKNRILSSKYSFYSFQYFSLKIYLVISEMNFYMKKNSIVMQLSKKVFILQIRLQSEKIV